MQYIRRAAAGRCTNTMAPSYQERIEAAARNNLARQINDRQISGNMNKVDAALATGRLYCVMSTNKKTNTSQLNNDNRRCPSLYEAEAIDFSKNLHRTREAIKRCVTCTRALHPLLDIKRAVCSFCTK
ncbi:orf52-like protein [Peridroma alphabaculovirus]|uniref:Orf52-like protein n=1 Tax=Peridroma alphabaculovirus TaxID=1346829 RepID=A0A068LKK6_9ABAC|nr:orf52-like protein [Peridroma alphabaculovirus]AIE47832.1 orf52-like protein [Peridroma alphabaculovirus]